MPQSAPISDPRAGALNLLTEFLSVREGQEIALVREAPGLGFYDSAAPNTVAAAASELGCRVRDLTVGLIRDPDDFPEEIDQALQHSDHVIFFARLGDQVRFRPHGGRATCTMCYALDEGFLGAAFCTLPHRFMAQVRQDIEGKLAAANEWRITCPKGTDITGTASAEGQQSSEFTLGTFPEVIFNPLSCRTMSGQVALRLCLMPTGNRRYEDDMLLLDAPLLAQVEKGRIVGFEGEPDLVEKVERHYRRVAGLFGLDPWLVHSWHAGIHPKTFYPGSAREDLERWGAVAFASPRYAHFHTCGDFPPGEIAWSVFDPTITVDGETHWQNGQFLFLEQYLEQWNQSSEPKLMRHDITTYDDIGVEGLPPLGPSDQP